MAPIVVRVAQPHNLGLPEKYVYRQRVGIYREEVDEETWVAHRADHRAVVTNAADPEMLAHVVASWPVPSAMPTSVDRLWQRACAQFRSGSIAYENFTDAVRTGFEAVDSALRHHIGDLLDDDDRRTFGTLIKLANRRGRLSAHQHEWLSAYALHFRNRLTHADRSEPLVLSPAMAAEMMEGIARFLLDLTPDDRI